jgi:polyisoprenoid-binding protein YceI
MSAIRILILSAIVAVGSSARAQTVHYEAQPGGSKMKIDGTSTLHDWTVECAVIGGFMEFDATFPEKAPGAAPSAVKPKVEVFVPVRQLKSGKKGMDAVMHDAMKQTQFPKIEYKMIDLKAKPGAAAGSAKSEFDATGALTIAGVTKTNTMPVTIERVEKTKLKVTGSTALKMTQFGIKPPSPDVPGLGALIKTGDDVKLTFEWLTRQAEQAAKAQ